MCRTRRRLRCLYYMYAYTRALMVQSRQSRGSRVHSIQSMLTILITDAFPILCSATMHSPAWQYPACLACSMAACTLCGEARLTLRLSTRPECK